MSAVFDFNASLNSVAPVNPMPFSVDVKRKKRVNCWWMSFVCLLSFVFTSQIKFGECCV